MKKILLGLFLCQTTVFWAQKKGQDVLHITLDATQQYQTIHSFGASDCWSIQLANRWSAADNQQIMDWLFSTENDKEAKPKGIGLSLWRFNIGAGTAYNGHFGNIKDTSRRTECFLQEDGSYDWSQQAAQRWYMQEAKKKGVKYLLAFTNSPPVWFTKTGLGNCFNLPKYEANIDTPQYPAFATFLAKTVDYLNKNGTKIDYLSHFNEPQWDWQSPQEGVHFSNKELAGITKAVHTALKNNNVETELAIGEAGQVEALYAVSKQNGGKTSDQIHAFFEEKGPPQYLGDILPKKISFHSYFTSNPVEKLIRTRDSVGKAAQAAGLELWQTEYFPFNENREETLKPNGSKVEIKDRKRDYSINYGLAIARTMHFDLTLANVTSWQTWLSVTVSPKWNDGLIGMDYEKDGWHLRPIKHLWTFGNFSRFVRPEMVRISVSSKNADLNDPWGLMVSAYKNKEGGVSAVVINYSDAPKTVKFDTKGLNCKKFTPYITSETENLTPQKKVRIGKAYTIPARAIVTFVSE